MVGPDDKPLLVLSRVGKGRVGLLLSDQMWLWARDYDGGGPYLDLLRRLAHWLMKEPELEEEALRASAKGREITVERQSMSDRERKANLVSPSGTKTTLALAPVAPGLSRAHLAVDRYGLYRAEDGDHVALVNVGPRNPLEMHDVVSTTEKLRPMAEATGGTVRRIAAGSGGNAIVDATRRLPEPRAELRRQRLYRRQADRRDRTARRQFDLRRHRFSRPGGAPRRLDFGVAARRRSSRQGSGQSALKPPSGPLAEPIPTSARPFMRGFGNPRLQGAGAGAS